MNGKMTLLHFLKYVVLKQATQPCPPLDMDNPAAAAAAPRPIDYGLIARNRAVALERKAARQAERERAAVHQREVARDAALILAEGKKKLEESLRSKARAEEAEAQKRRRQDCEQMQEAYDDEVVYGAKFVTDGTMGAGPTCGPATSTKRSRFRITAEERALRR